MPEVTERPILFSAPMVRAILEGRKTVTRREVKKPAALDCLAAGFEPAFLALPGNADLCPYGKPGDRLWVREAWQADAQVDSVPPRELGQGEPIQYPADGASRQTGCSMISPGKTRPSIHMPRWVSRILLEITDVRVERLQDIIEEQAKAEGVRLMRDGSDTWVSREGPGNLVTPWPTAKEAFRDLWNSINGPQAWNANPWVWAITFRRVEQ
ncbi:hypothetical protein [Pseudomonas syringae group genomosp. 3]|uniref:hypothetical protein n=1 Tax=Pseudomonas syringae group genomosp. 3 TaxID=251701 RepID=UPI0006B8A8BE|nr:hypothetical protein [Pseudomonas syringae group genomosp. 3]KPC18256.1 Uncharacterized protein AC503_3247 [Pseudomonas syringae pv. maculicola]